MSITSTHNNKKPLTKINLRSRKVINLNKNKMKNFKLQKIVSELSKNGQSTEEMIDNLTELFIEHHTKDENEYFKLKFVFDDLKEFLKCLNRFEVTPKIEEIINDWFSQHEEQNISNKIYKLHDLMIRWLDVEYSYNEKLRISVFKTYRGLRQFLIQLKTIELEFINKKYLKVS